MSTLADVFFLLFFFPFIHIWLVVWNIFYFPIYWEFHHPNWLNSYFSEGLGQPPTSHILDIYIYINIVNGYMIHTLPHYPIPITQYPYISSSCEERPNRGVTMAWVKPLGQGQCVRKGRSQGQGENFPCPGATLVVFFWMERSWYQQDLGYFGVFYNNDELIWSEKRIEDRSP